MWLIVRMFLLISLLGQFHTESSLAADTGPDSYGVEETEQWVRLRRGTDSVVVYNKQPPERPPGIDEVYARTGFLHPLVTPAGKVVSDVYPIDHPHQDGVFSAWVKTTWRGRPVDFWNLAGNTGRVVHHRVTRLLDQGMPTAGFEVELIHRALLEPAADVLLERWRVQLVPNDGTWHTFDLTVEQTALTEDPLQVHQHRYGGVALRGASGWLLQKPSDRTEPGLFLTDQGWDRRSGNHQPARWVAMNGQVQGAPVTVCVLSHAENFRAPQTVRLHPSKPYFCFAPCVTGEFVIDRQHPYHARYRYLLMDTAPDPDWIEQQWQAWCGSGAK